MIVVAIDAATDRLSVAAGAEAGPTAERHLAGARGHARALIPLLQELLTELGGAPGDVGRVLLADGPGSFTGLRVAASAAKALVRAGEVSFAVTPSLLARGWRAAGPAGGTVLVAASALRGEVYAGWYRLLGHAGVSVVHEAMALGYEAVAGGTRPDLIAGDAPDGFLESLAHHWDTRLAPREAGMADARALLELDQVTGGVREVGDAASWEPIYGRPAEAQAKWEREHGRPLPDPVRHPR